MSRARILVIDDEPMVRQLLTGMLRRDYIVAVATDGQEGSTKAIEHVPDLALIDVQMPKWDGLKTLKAFRANPSLQKVPVIILTVDSRKSTVLTAIQSGASDYMIKADLTAERLLAKIEKLLSSGQRFAAPAPVRVDVPSTAVPSVPAAAAVASTDRPSSSAFDEKAVQAILDSWE